MARKDRVPDYESNKSTGSNIVWGIIIFLVLVFLCLVASGGGKDASSQPGGLIMLTLQGWM